MKKGVKSAAAEPSSNKLKPGFTAEPAVDPYECPFREFRDTELGNELWGLNNMSYRAFLAAAAAASKDKGAKVVPSSSGSAMWIDDQTQPLPRSIRHHLHGWIRAEELAESRWEAEAVIFEETVNDMTVVEWQLSHIQVLLRSTFCRRVLSTCFILEKAAGVLVEHQDDYFSFMFGPEGWRAKFHIYSPGMKSGGGIQHKPMLSKNGCYLVRLYYLGSWRCIWVSDLVPVDASGSPLLPFSPLIYHQQPAKARGQPTVVTSSFVHMWPLLLCKALLKLWAPDMSCDDEDTENIEDEPVSGVHLLHLITGGMCLTYDNDEFNWDSLWDLLQEEVPVFTWEGEEIPKKLSPPKKGPIVKEPGALKGNLVTILLRDSHDIPPYALNGITPALEMDVILYKIRDLPVKKPLPEPEIPFWKTFRWVDWARQHGLYNDYECPRTRYVKMNGLMKLSCAPHLLEVTSTMSINLVVKEEKRDAKKSKVKDVFKSAVDVMPSTKEDQRDWVSYDATFDLMLTLTILVYPSLYKFGSCVGKPSRRNSGKAPTNKDVVAPASAPVYLSIDSPETSTLKISLDVLNPRILLNTGGGVYEFTEKSYVILEVFEWFLDEPLALAKAFVDSRGYDTVEVKFQPGRHYCRLWIHSPMKFHVAMITKDNLVVGTRDVIQNASIKECPWIYRFLGNLSSGFYNWIRTSRNRRMSSIMAFDREFFSCYQPDLKWNPNVVGYPKCLLHWMFRQALRSHLFKRLSLNDYENICTILRRYLMDPDFGLPPKPLPPPETVREIADKDPCDCTVPTPEDMGEEIWVVNTADEEVGEEEEKELVPSDVMDKLLQAPQFPVISNRCKFATEELPCGILREEIYKKIVKHEAATCIQAHWRGHWARKVLNNQITIPPDVLKLVMDNAFGNFENVSQLMNEFFLLFPGAKYAYSIASGLAGVYGLQQHSGTAPIGASCKWIPFFQGVFYCHGPVKVHFDLHSSLQHSTVAVYDNDTGEQMPQAYNTHITFDMHPNELGYTVMGHGSLNKALGAQSEASWQLSILCSVDKVFHICDNGDPCLISPMTSSTKFFLAEFYIPNRKNIIGGVQIAVTKIEAVSFRAEATSRDLVMVAILKTTESDGTVEVLGQCHGIGEICWPYLRLKPSNVPLDPGKGTSVSTSVGNLVPGVSGSESPSSKIAKSKSKHAAKEKSVNYASQSSLKLKGSPFELQPKIYTIEVTAANRWALSIDQWRRVIDARNTIGTLSPPSSGKTQGTTPKGNIEKESMFRVIKPLPGDAFAVLECATAIGGGAVAKRDDDRDLLFALEKRSWETKDPGRNLRGEMIRKQFREDFLLQEPEPLISVPVIMEEIEEEEESSIKAGPSPISSQSVYVEAEAEEEGLYFTIPDRLKDKFEPFYFVQLCTKPMEQEESVLLTSDMIAAAKRERQDHFEAALEYMHQLQTFNEIHVLGRQKKRCELLQHLFIDSNWSPEVDTVLAERDEAITVEILERQASAIRKKAPPAGPAAGKKAPPTGTAAGKKK